MLEYVGMECLWCFRGCYTYMGPQRSVKYGPKPLSILKKSIILHTLGAQVILNPKPSLRSRAVETKVSSQKDPDGKVRRKYHAPRPSSYTLLGPKYPLLGTIYPQLRVQGRSWQVELRFRVQGFSLGDRASKFLPKAPSIAKK